MTKDQKILQYLRTIAEDVPPVNSARIAAAIVYKKDIVGVGVCSRRSDPLQKRYGKVPEAIYLHAEISAIKNSIKRMQGMTFLRNSTLYIARRKIVDGAFVDGLACPCVGCKRAILSFEIPNVVWTDEV